MRDVMFLNAGYFLEQFTSWRLLGVEGRLRGGKSLLAVALARWLWTQGLVRGVFSNMPIDPSYVPVLHSCINTVVIADEMWMFSDARRSAQRYEGYGAMFGKLGSYLISPSVNPVDKRMRPLMCEREMDIWVINGWLYRWANSRSDEGRFLLFNYDAVFDHYDHRFIPSDDGGIKDVMMAEIASLAGSTRRIFTVDDWSEYQRAKRDK